MVRILAIGDFHGKFPKKLEREARKSDLVLSTGDFKTFTLKKQFFKYSWRRGIQVCEVIGKKKTKEAVKKDWKNAEKVLKIVNGLPVPVFTVLGNYDDSTPDGFDIKKIPHLKNMKIWEWEEQDFITPLLKKYKHIKEFTYSYVKLGKLIFIGAYGGTIPGKVKSKNFKKHKAKLDKLFKKFRKENREGRVIFVFHNMPYNCRLDKIRDKTAPKEAYGKHYGSKLIRRVIEQHKPILGIGGHLHENQGKIKIRETTVLNTGAALDGKAAVIEFDEKKGKIKKIRFIR
jgi:Icc-related predicted phosphoesterase